MALAGSWVGASAAAAVPSDRCVGAQVDEFGVAGRVGAPLVATDAQGRGAVVWSQGSSGPRVITARRIARGAVTGRDAVRRVGARYEGVEVVAAAAGRVVMVFRRLNLDALPWVVAAELDGRGRWGPGRVISRIEPRPSASGPRPSVSASVPSLSGSPGGGVRAAWIEVRHPSGWQIVSAVRTGPGAWTAPATLATVAFGRSADHVQVFAGPGGRAVVAWVERSQAGDGRGLNALRVLQLGEGGVPLGEPASVREGPGVVADLALGGSPRGAYLAWRDGDAAGASAILGARIPFTGAPGPLAELSPGRTEQVAVDPLVASAPTGRWTVVAWRTIGERSPWRARALRLDTVTGQTLGWWSRRILANSYIAGAVQGGAAALVVRAGRSGRRVTVLVTGRIDRASPTASRAVAPLERLPAIERAPSVGLGGGRAVIAATRGTDPQQLHTALEVWSCAL